MENGQSNLCFIAPARTVQELESNVENLLLERVMSNPRAAHTLANAKPVSPWLAMALPDFGGHDPAPAPGLIAVGDASSFIDPFTGSGILMALQSGELAARVISQNWRLSPAAISHAYRSAYGAAFRSRLRYCAWLRRAAFASPFCTQVLFPLFAAGANLRRVVAHATRSSPAGYIEMNER